MQRAVNPQTGEVLFLVNNQWTPPSQTAKNPKTGQSAYLVNNEWQILDPFKMGQESGEAKTTNPFLGFVGRGAELIGSGVEAVAEVGERLGDKLELAMPLSNLTPEQVKNEQQLKPLFDFAKSLEDFNKNIGYSPSTKLSDLPGNPLKTIPFVAERVITSTPDMAAAFAAAPAYFTARTKEILDERVKNDNKTLDDATIGDVSTAAGAAAFETLFERFAVGRLLPGGGATGKTAPGRIAKETGIQSGTEFAEEFGTYAAETAGTKKGFDLEEASLAGLEGAIVGGGLGATVQTSKEGLDAYRRSKDQTSPDAEPEDPISTTPAGPVDPTLTAPITPTPVLEQEGAIAPEVVPPEVVPPEAIAPEVVPPESIAPAPQIAPVSQPTPIQIYNNPLDEVTAEVIANPDNRFSILMTDLATGQTMDGGTFDTADEANARAAQSIGMSVKPIAYIGPVQAPPQTTPPTIAPPAVTPPEVPAATPPASIEAAPTTSPEVAPAVEPAATPTITPPADTPIGQEPVIPTSGFRTEKGSIYALDDLGRTSRTKMSEGKGKGTTYDPHAALYVTPEDAQSILSDMQSGSMDQGASVRLGYIDVENNVFKNITDTSQIPAGAEAVVGVIDKNKNQMIGFYKAQLKPAIGLAPVEKLYTPDGMSNTHIGNKIVELFGQTTPAVKPTITPETPPETPPASTRTEQEVQIDINRIRQQIRQAKTAVTKGTVGPEVVSPLEAKLEALENELSQVKATPRSAPTPPKLPETPPPPKKLKFEIDKTPPEIYKEISKLDIPGLAQWAVDNAPNDFAKEVASKIQSRIKDFSSRNINMKGPVILNDTSRVRGYKGKVTYKLTKGGFEFIYRLNGLVRGKEAPGHGLDYQTILHELVHAATVIQTVGLKKSDPRIQDLEKLRRQIRTKFKKDLAENKFDQVKQKATINHISYMLKNVDELMAVGLSDGEVQKYLKTVKVSKDFNAFGKLVEIARQILGLPPNTQSALEALASTTDQMLSSPLEKLDADLRESGRFKVSRKSDDEADVEIDKDIVTINLQEPQDDLFGDENKTLHELSENLPKAKKKLPPGRSPELAALAQLLQQGKVTKEEFDAAVNKYRPIPVYEEPLEPATDQQVVNALYSDKQPRANVTVATGTKVGLRLDIPAWNRHKTFVVAIHEKRKSASAVGKSIGYRSVAMVKNVVFTVGNQLKALEIAAGEGKSALQTMEGEYVDVSPADALEMAKKAIKSDRYIQVGFDPIRHSYFFDRRTTLPVLKADAVLQIGNMILARGVEFGKKESFLYNIDATPQMTEAEISQGVTDVREEQIAEYARLRAKRERLVQEVIGGANTIDTQRELTNLDNVTKALKEDIDAGYTPSKSPENFLNRALKAFDKGDISAEVLATIQEAYNKTPFILNGLRLSIRTPKDGTREIGNFNPFARIVTLWNGTRGVENPSTVRHELTHSLEQMMTAAQRKVLIDAWSKDFEKAVKKNTDAPSRLYFKKVLQFIDNPSQESFAAATAAMPSYEFYQYMSPSEYWAVNAETLMASKLGTAWSRFVAAIKKYVEALKNVFGFNNKYAIHKTFDQLMRDKPTRMSTDSLIDFVASAGARPVTLSNISQNIFGQPLPEASWGRPDDSKKDDFVYIFADKQVDTKKVLQSIRKAGKQIIDKWNPYLLEELFHGRTATRTKKFLKEGLEPLIKEIGDRGLNIEIVEKYLHNRHAKARNDFNAKRDPNMPDGGSGIKTAAAQAYLDGLNPKQKRNLEAVAKMVDDIVNGTQEVLVKTGQESQETIDAWKKALPNYVPLQREETDYDIKNVGIGVGSGFAVKGPFSRAAVGSSRKVVDILANLAAQRERAIVRGEKMRVAKALYGLVASNPNPGFWLAFDPEAIKNPQEALNDLMSLGLKNDKGEKFSLEDLKSFVSEPMVRRVDEATNQVVLKPNALLKNASTTFPVRINGKEKYIIFNANDPRATRMAEAMKNLDADQLGRVLNYTQQITQYFAKINTQYNPIFGVINFARDIQGAVLQLSTTPLRYKKKEVLSGVLGALRGIYAEERRSRAGKPPSKDSYAELWREFQEEGGQTGFRDQFSRMQDRADALQAILDPSSWTKSPLGKVFTAGGTLKVPLETARKIAAPVFDWLSDYNQTMENAVRLSAYKVAKEKGMTKQQAASLAKNLTVNFNRKGQIGRQAGALYAFFNAAVQGTARMLETLRGPAGKTIIGGGLLIGSAQAMLLAAFGFDEDEPPDFVKERNIVIPTGGGKYITVPMPLGYNVIPNTSRILTEWTMSGFKDTHKRVAQITGAALDMFNPIGNAGWSIQTLAPTVADPLVALAENKDWTGKPIAKEDISNLDPTPGYSRSKETASYISKAMAKFLNAATGGTDYTPGGASPTPDQIDYLIGQLTGGVGRELLKAEQTVTSQFTGEELPIYKVPLVGRFVGDSEGQAAERNRFYNNIILLNKHEREIKGRQKDRIPARDYLMEYPEARLYSYANQVERNIRTLRKRRDALIEQDAPKERVKQVENQMTVQMKRFNERVKSAQE
jgi:hypothetical protein